MRERKAQESYVSQFLAILTGRVLRMPRVLGLGRACTPDVGRACSLDRLLPDTRDRIYIEKTNTQYIHTTFTSCGMLWLCFGVGTEPSYSAGPTARSTYTGRKLSYGVNSGGLPESCGNKYTRRLRQRPIGVVIACYSAETQCTRSQGQFHAKRAFNYIYTALCANVPVVGHSARTMHKDDEPCAAEYPQQGESR